MATETMSVTPGVLTWARERSGFTAGEVARKQGLKKIALWEAGSESPTYPQLEKLSEFLKIPVAVFFFPEPPDIPPVEETFRTLYPDLVEHIPPQIRLLLRKARAFQMGLEELFEGRNPAERIITRDLSFKSSDDVKKIASEVREYLQVSLEKQFLWRDEENTLREWRQAFFNAGVYVFKDSFGIEGYWGFCLYDSEFPVVYVNNTATKTRQIFTLFHELAHLVFRTSGVGMPDEEHMDELALDGRRIEVICNRFASCFLVPDDALTRLIAEAKIDRNVASELARKFKVSREVIYRRFLERDLISETEYKAAAQEWTEQGSNKSNKGGHYYNTKISYLGKNYIEQAYLQFYKNRIDEEQLAEYLDTKPKNLSKFEEYAFRTAR